MNRFEGFAVRHPRISFCPLKLFLLLEGNRYFSLQFYAYVFIFLPIIRMLPSARKSYDMIAQNALNERLINIIGNFNHMMYEIQVDNLRNIFDYLGCVVLMFHIIWMILYFDNASLLTN